MGRGKRRGAGVWERMWSSVQVDDSSLGETERPSTGTASGIRMTQISSCVFPLPTRHTWNHCLWHSTKNSHSLTGNSFYKGSISIHVFKWKLLPCLPETSKLDWVLPRGSEFTDLPLKRKRHLPGSSWSQSCVMISLLAFYIVRQKVQNKF
jgi:hypothetical protein